MTDKRYLFRGFHPDENGKKTITLNGDKIKGEWVYWNHCGRFVDLKTGAESEYTEDGYKAFFVNEIEIVRETIGQWVMVDKKGKDVFLGDMVWAKGKSSYSATFRSIIGYDLIRIAFVLQEDNGTFFDDLHDYEIKLIGNKWEVTE